MIGLPATSLGGGSRIVPQIAGGPVTSLKSDVDVVVTELGVERVERLVAVAHPDHRAALRAGAPSWV